MSTATKKKTAAEAAEEIKATPETEAAAHAEPVGQTQEEKCEKEDEAFFAKLPNPCVYCGPSVRGVARQFTVYTGGIPDVLKGFIKEHRAARGLIVSVERFAQMRVRLETPGTGEAILFRKVRAEL